MSGITVFWFTKNSFLQSFTVSQHLWTTLWYIQIQCFACTKLYHINCKTQTLFPYNIWVLYVCQVVWTRLRLYQDSTLGAPTFAPISSSVRTMSNVIDWCNVEGLSLLNAHQLNWLNDNGSILGAALSDDHVDTVTSYHFRFLNCLCAIAWWPICWLLWATPGLLTWPTIS